MQPVDDEESLFGSPPSSPRIGRSPSPALALPSSSGSIVNLQNVGTIALPGSHLHSELPINPLALPLNCFLQDADSRPSALTSRFSSTVPSSSASSSRASSQGPRKKPNRRRRDDESVGRLPPPEIPLPDPAAPPPSNWLRSQSALLGHAGLVGGVRTATLSNRHSRGSTAINPIDVDGDQPPLQSQQPLHRYKPPVYPDLPPPSTQEIVQILIKERDVFPILQDILKLIQRGTFGSAFVRRPSKPEPTSESDSTFSSSSRGPALKKRKLSKVPAGAVDWDVPYPFQPGEGPKTYSATWERDRERQLILRLASLIRSASRKAAIRKYIKKNQELEKLQAAMQRGEAELSPSEMKELQHAMPKVDGHYRPETLFYGLPNVPSQDILADASNGPTRPLSSSPCASPATDPSPLDELLASLVNLAQCPDQGGSTSSHLLVNTNSQESTPELDQGVLDNWLSTFQSFNPSGPSEQPEIQSYPSSSQLFPDFPLEFSSWNEFPSTSNSQSSFSYSPNLSSSLFPMDVDGNLPSAAEAFQSLPLGVSNQSQLNITIPSSSFTASNLSALSGPPSLTHSPIPSLGSFGDAELLTPTLPAGELGPLDVSIVIDPNESEILSLFSDMTGRIGRGFETRLEDSIESKQTPQGSDYLRTPVADQEVYMASSASANAMDAQLSNILPALVSTVCAGPPVSNAGTSSVFKPPVVRPFHSSDRTTNKTELLKRAKERRAQLAEEVVKARTQLWETTIEHGMLTRIAKLYS